MNPAPKPEPRRKNKRGKTIRTKTEISVVLQTEKRSTVRELKSNCDQLWRHCVALRAFLRSDVSGKPASIDGDGKIYGMNSHHIRKKSTHRNLRHELVNGCYLIELSEHLFGAHGSDEQKREIEKKIAEKFGEELFDWLDILEKQIQDERDKMSTTFWYYKKQGELMQSLAKFTTDAYEKTTGDDRVRVELYIRQHNLQSYLKGEIL